MSHPVRWFQIQGKEGGPLQKFYADVFAWKMSPSPDGSMMIVSKEKGGIDGGIGPSQTGAPSVTVYVDCDDIDAQLAKIEAAGGRTAMPKMELPAGMGHIAGFLDPAGNWVGLWSPAKPASSERRARDKAGKKVKSDKKTSKKDEKKASKKEGKKAKKKG